jgi:hypothetical protein
MIVPCVYVRMVSSVSWSCDCADEVVSVCVRFVVVLGAFFLVWCRVLNTILFIFALMCKLFLFCRLSAV